MLLIPDQNCDLMKALKCITLSAIYSVYTYTVLCLYVAHTYIHSIISTYMYIHGLMCECTGKYTEVWQTSHVAARVVTDRHTHKTTTVTLLCMRAEGSLLQY